MVTSNTINNGEKAMLLELPPSSQSSCSSSAAQIDALPYIDDEYGDPKVKAEVDRLIEEEMRRSSNKPLDYLKDPPPVAKFNFEDIMPTRRSTRRRPGPTPTLIPTSDPTPVMDSTTIKLLVAQHVAAALANYEINRNVGSGQGGGGGGGGSSSEGDQRGSSRTCTYKEFMKCKPKTFYGNEGVVGLTRWIEKMESVFQISLCTEDCKVKFATCMLEDAALTWWNGHVKTMGISVANAMSWNELKQMLIEEYCPRYKMQELEHEFWNLTMKDAEIAAYTTRFNDLATFCPSFVTPEYKKIERYIWGLAPQIKGLVTASRPTTFDSTKRLAFNLTNQEIRQRTMVQKADTTNIGDKRKYDDFSRKEREIEKVYATTASPQKQYMGNLPKCDKCKYHHLGECREFFCHRCTKKGHENKYCRNTNPGVSIGGNRGCYECGELGHFKRDCPKLEDYGGNARAKHS